MALTDNLVAYWKLDESSGNAADATGNGNTLTNTGGITYESGKINKGARNNGSSNRLSGTITGLTSTSNNTWSFQIKLNSFNGYIVDHLPTSNGVRFIIYGNGTNGITIFANGNTINITGMSLGTFYHVVVTKNGTGWTAYLDNVSKGTTTTGGGSYINNLAFSLLSPADSFGSQPDVVIDEFGIWDRALSAGEVSQLYNGGAGLQYPFESTVNSGFFAFM